MKKKTKQQQKSSLKRGAKRNKRLKSTQKDKAKRRQVLSESKKLADKKFEQHMESLFGGNKEQ